MYSDSEVQKLKGFGFGEISTSANIEKVYLEATGHKIKTYFLLGEPHWIIFNPGVSGLQRGLRPGVIMN